MASVHGALRRIVPARFAATTVLALAAACSSTAATGTGPTPIAPLPAGPTIATATIDPTKPGFAIPASFVGISFEMAGLTQSFNGVNGQTNPVFIQLLANFAPFNGPPLLRIGGNSEDQSWWNPTGAAKPAGVTFDITPSWVQTLAGVLQQSGSRAIVGVNLALNDTAQAVAFTKAVSAAVPASRIAGFELGNETDLFSRAPNDSTPGKRPTTWAFAQYDSEYTSYATAVRSAISPAPMLVGPAWATFTWISALPTFLRHPGLGVVSLHAYPAGNGQALATDPKNPTIARLLLDSTSHVAALKYATAIGEARAAGIPFRMGEMNSAYNGGKAGVSNAFASALWGSDFMFELAALGASGVNFHGGGGSAYTPFRFGANGALPLDVRPLYLGMLFFAEATAHGARLLPVTLQSSANVKVWATLDRANTLRVAVINKDSAATGSVTLVLPSARGNATVARLSAPSLAALTGVTWAGQTFDGSTDGKVQGTRQVEALVAVKGTYVVQVPAGSAALVTW